MPPEVRYARSGDVHLAYQIFGEGPRDLLYVPPWVSHVEVMWESPEYEHFLERLGAIARVIVFDRRGMGLSDPVPPGGGSLLDGDMDDIRAVMSAAGSERAVLFSGSNAGGQACALFAATSPEAVEALVLYGTFARGSRDTQYPWAPTTEQVEVTIEQIDREWGGSFMLPLVAPSRVDDADFARWWARLMRMGASPATVAALVRSLHDVDIRDVLPSISMPTLVLHRQGDRVWRVEGSRYMAERIPDAKLVELPGEDHLPIVGDADAILDEVEEFLTGARPEPEPERVLATVLFTDIVGSTERAGELGDRAWRELLERHDRLVRTRLDRWRGREVKTMGDGFLAIFDGPGRAIRCASEVVDGARALGIDLRAGLHTGECDLVGGDVSGMAVNIGARVVAEARAGEVLVSSTVRDLVVGSGMAFADRGTRPLKGVPGEWRLFSVTP